MKPPPFAYFAPGSLQEATSLLAEHGEDAKVIAGGQSLIPLLSLRLARPSVLVDLNGIDELCGVDTDADTTTIGAIDAAPERRALRCDRSRRPAARRGGAVHRARRHPLARDDRRKLVAR